MGYIYQEFTFLVVYKFYKTVKLNKFVYKDLET